MAELLEPRVRALEVDLGLRVRVIETAVRPSVNFKELVVWLDTSSSKNVELLVRHRDKTFKFVGAAVT